MLVHLSLGKKINELIIAVRDSRVRLARQAARADKLVLDTNNRIRITMVFNGETDRNGIDFLVAVLGGVQMEGK